MSNVYSSETFDERDDYPQITQADLDRATFRVGLKPAPRKRNTQEEALRRIIREEPGREDAAVGTRSESPP